MTRKRTKLFSDKSALAVVTAESGRGRLLARPEEGYTGNCCVGWHFLHHVPLAGIFVKTGVRIRVKAMGSTRIINH